MRNGPSTFSMKFQKILIGKNITNSSLKKHPKSGKIKMFGCNVVNSRKYGLYAKLANFV